jgi:putative ABC transport system permease protein
VSLLPFPAGSLAACLYGVLSYLVSQRTKEIGIRMTLGATATAVMRSVLGQSLKLRAIGAAMRLRTRARFSRLMAAKLEMVDTFDRAAYLGVWL